MKANAPKRNVFQDAVDLISPETVNDVDNGQAMISVERIVPFHNHPFRLYEGKRLDKEFFAGNGMVGFVAKERVDGKLVLAKAVQVLKMGA